MTRISLLVPWRFRMAPIATDLYRFYPVDATGDEVRADICDQDWPYGSVLAVCRRCTRAEALALMSLRSTELVNEAYNIVDAAGAWVHAAKESRRLLAIGNDLWPCRERRQEQGEQRWYRNGFEYGTVSDGGKPLHFWTDRDGKAFACDDPEETA